MSRKVLSTKLVITFLILTAMLQLSDRMAVVFLNYYLNRQLLYSLAISNSLAIALSIVILCLCIWLAVRQKINPFLIVVFTAAAISNVLDRIFYGGVVDYLGFINLFIINPADTIIVISLILTGWKLLFRSQKPVI